MPLVDSALSREWTAEWTIGKKLALEAEAGQIVIGDPSLNQYLNRLEETIVRNSHLQGCFVVKLIHDVEANAYSLPGGFLYVTSGLVLMAESEGELAAALAHETAHVSAKHFARIQHKRKVWGRVALATGPPGYLLGRLIGPLLTQKLIRNSEFEADRLCLHYQSASGYDPTEFGSLLQTAFQDDDEPASFVKRLFETHPSTTTRIRRLGRLSNRLPASTLNSIVDTSSFHESKQRLARLLQIANPDLERNNAR